MCAWQQHVTRQEIDEVFGSFQRAWRQGITTWSLYQQKPLLLSTWSRALQPWKDQLEPAAIMIKQIELAALYQQQAEQQAQRRTTATGTIYDYRFSKVER